METLTKPYRKLMEPSMENINNTLNLIKEFVKKNNYVVKGKLSNPLDKNDIFGFKIKNYGVSKKTKKALSRSMELFNLKQSRRNANRFLHILHKKMCGKPSPHIEVSEKEQSIITSRKMWVEARNKALEALKAYKTTKGSFYKKVV